MARRRGEVFMIGSRRINIEEVSLEEEPEQPRSERRWIRASYRELRNKIAREKDELTRPDSEKFTDRFQEIENLHIKVQKPREQISDGEAVSDMTVILEDSVKGVSRKDGPTPSDFVAALIRRFPKRTDGSNSDEEAVDIDWRKLGLEACVILREAPGVCTMMGPMDSQPKPRRTYTARGRREKVARMTQPDEVDGASTSQEKQETDVNMEVMFASLRSWRSVRFEALVLNRATFAQTVENIFSLSFLVKDGRVEIKIEADGTHLVVPRNAPSGKERESVHNTQFVFGFGYKDWELMKSSIPEGTEAMPHRTRAKPCAPQVNGTPVRITSRNRARETSSQDEAHKERTTGKRRKL